MKIPPDELSFEERPDYLYASIKALSLDRKTALEYLAEIADKCASIRCKRMLLDRDVPEMLPDKDLFRTMKDFVRMSTGTRIAFVNKHVQIDAALKNTVGYGTGQGADFSYFNDIAPAEAWLRQGLGP